MDPDLLLRADKWGRRYGRPPHELLYQGELETAFDLACMEVGSELAADLLRGRDLVGTIER